MILDELYESLSRGELSNLALGSEGEGFIRDKDKKKIVMFANDGLLDLYTKFPLNEKDVLVEMRDHITNYHLLKRFAVHGPEDGEPFRYILDLPREPFKEDVIRILTVFDSIGRRLPLNDDERPDSVFSPQSGILQVPFPKSFRSLSVHYQAQHEPLTGDPTQEIVLPNVLVPALRAYVASKVLGSSTTQESTMKSQEYLTYYEAKCVDVVQSDVISSSVSTTNTRFYKNGWI